MPSTSEEKINKLIRKRLQRTLESLSSAGFSRQIAKRIQLDEIKVKGVELDGTDGDTVSSAFYTNSSKNLPKKIEKRNRNEN
jgi:hypothetical protein